MTKKKRLTKVVSFLYKHKFLDESCFEDGELTENDFMDGGEERMAKSARKDNDVVMDIIANAVVVGGCVAAFMVACSAVYYCTKGTIGLFKTVGQFGNKIINR